MFAFIIFSETSYMSRDLWEQLMTKEKERVKKLEEKYGDLMRSKSVSMKLIDAYPKPFHFLTTVQV